VLVLDNARDAGVITPFLKHRPPGCLLIVTSRESMPFAGITTIRLEELGPDEAIRVLRDLLGPERASLDELGTLAKQCGYLPLALHAAAGVLRSHSTLPIGTYLSALAKEQERLRWLKVKGLAKLDVAVVLGFSVRQLDEDHHALAVRWSFRQRSTRQPPPQCGRLRPVKLSSLYTILLPAAWCASSLRLSGSVGTT
jgi:hypothetical protein